MSSKVTVFSSISNTGKPQYSDAKSVLALIQTGGKQKGFIETLRSLPPEQYKKQKIKLPIVLWAGSFTQRNKNSMAEPSGLMILDFDGVDDMDGLKKRLTEATYVYSVFMSPSGRGYKALVRIPRVSTDEEYKQYFAALKKEWKELDSSGKDIGRSCFFSYDPNIYINDKADVWDKKYQTPKQKETGSVYQVKDGAWDNINTALRKIEDSIDGEKHDVRTKVAYLFGGWVGAKDLRYQDAYNLLEGAVMKNTSDPKGAMQDIKDCLAAGMDKPLNMTEQKRILEMQVGLGRRYVPMSETFDGVKSFYEKGYQRGWEVGWRCAHPYISLLRGSTSYWFGAPFSGKSQVVHEILVNIVKAEEAKGNSIYVAMLSPETGDVNQVYGELISIAARENFTGDFKMKEEVMIKWADFISKHFILIDFEGEDAKMKDMFSQVEAAEREFGIKIDIVSIDPLNYLSVEEGRHSRRDLAISKDLDYLLADARKNNRHNILVTHARDQQIQKNKDGQWYYPVVSPREILDGQSFYRKGMLMVSVYRPLDIKNEPLPNEHGEPYLDNTTQLWVQKAKPKGSSQVGCVTLYYDFKKNCYYEMDSLGTKRYALDSLKESENKPKQIQQNTTFDEQGEHQESDENPPF